MRWAPSARPVDRAFAGSQVAGFFTMVVTAVAANLPARRAARLEVVDALRFE